MLALCCLVHTQSGWVSPYLDEVYRSIRSAIAADPSQLDLSSTILQSIVRSSLAAEKVHAPCLAGRMHGRCEVLVMQATVRCMLHARFADEYSWAENAAPSLGAEGNW